MGGTVKVYSRIGKGGGYNILEDKGMVTYFFQSGWSVLGGGVLEEEAGWRFTGGGGGGCVKLKSLSEERGK